MQQLPYVVVTNPHISEVYDLYYTAFDTFRKVPEIKTLEDNDRFCDTVSKMLRAHLTVIPKLGMGVLECGGLMDDHELDKFMNTVLRSVSHQHNSLLACSRMSRAVANLSSTAHLPPRNCRATPRPDRYLPCALVLARRQALRVRIHRRGLPQMRSQGSRRAVRARDPGDSQARVRAGRADPGDPHRRPPRRQLPVHPEPSRVHHRRAAAELGAGRRGEAPAPAGGEPGCAQGG